MQQRQHDINKKPSVFPFISSVAAAVRRVIGCYSFPFLESQVNRCGWLEFQLFLGLAEMCKKTFVDCSQTISC